MIVEKLAVDSVLGAGRLAANTVKDSWSVMDAAAEKPAPGKLLGQKAVHSIQGVTDSVQKGTNAALNSK
jgi:hypothetical protein